jgi:hypothetical protein
MKTMLERGWRIILTFAMVSAVSITIADAQRSVSLQVFYDELQPYGTWMDHGQYGYVWIPRVDAGFVPYGTNGYWINTTYGNTWVSDYDWGWAPFHYGRWFFDDFHGWMWVPDTTWGPAWVAWRSGGGYYGWAPLMPGFGIHLSVNYYNRIPHRYWSFVPYRYVTYRHVYRHCVPRPTVVNIINHTTIITHNHTDNRRQTYFTGPSRNEIERRGGGRVQMHSIAETDRPGRTQVERNTANIYKPDVDKPRDSRSRAVPATYVRKDPSGKMEMIQRGADRNPANQNASRIKELDNSSRTSQRERSVESFEREKSTTPSDVQRTIPNDVRRENQRTNPNTTRSYERIRTEPTNTARDRYEAPPVQRAPANRETPQRSYQTERRETQQRTYETQRRTNPQPQVQPTQRQNPVRRQENSSVQRQPAPSYRDNSNRSTQQSQRSTQFRKSDSGNAGQPKVNTGSRSAPSRQRN